MPANPGKKSSFKFDTSAVDDALRRLSDYPDRIALDKAAQRAKDAMITEAARQASLRYHIAQMDIKGSKKKEIKGKVKFARASADGIKIIFAGRPLTARRFLAGQWRKGKQIVTHIKRGDKKSWSPHTFVATMPKNGTEQIVSRTGDARYPLEVFRTLSVPQMIDAEGVRGPIIAKGREVIMNRFKHEHDRVMKKITGGGRK